MAITLPIELIGIIVRHAALQHPRTAQALALVSRDICQLTASERWATVVITSKRQLLRFLLSIWLAEHGPVHWKEPSETLETDSSCSPVIQDMLPVLRQTVSAFDKETLSVPRTPRPNSPSSAPCYAVRSHVRNLFIETQCQGADDYWKQVVAACQVLTNRHWLVFADSTSHDHSCMGFQDLDHLSIGSEERDVMQWCSASEVTCIYQGEEELLTNQGRPYMTGRQNLKRVHVIGIDPQSAEAGVEMPVAPLHDRRAGSASSVYSSSERAGTLTHVRYDTRRFALRPASVTASRLRPFFTEVALSSEQSNPSGGHTSLESARATFTYSGDPHAAPSSGAGSFTSGLASHLPKPISVWDSQSPEASLLRERHFGTFQSLHLAWDVDDSNAELGRDWLDEDRRGSAPETVDTDGDTESTTALETGGWPRERFGAWTERADRNATLKFKGELSEAIWQLYGWKPAPRMRKPDVSISSGSIEKPLRHDEWYQFVADGSGQFGERIAAGYGEKERNDLHRLEEVSKQAQGRSKAESELERGESKPSALRYAVRAPSTLLKLGGPGAFTRQIRLSLFLDRAAGGRGAW